MSTEKPTTAKATAKKPTTAKATAKKASATKATKKTESKGPARKRDGKTRFPRKELNAWLRTNSTWDHQVWTDLLEELTTLGFKDWTSSQEGRDKIGIYIEENKKG